MQIKAWTLPLALSLALVVTLNAQQTRGMPMGSKAMNEGANGPQFIPMVINGGKKAWAWGKSLFHHRDVIEGVHRDVFEEDERHGIKIGRRAMDPYWDEDE